MLATLRTFTARRTADRRTATVAVETDRRTAARRADDIAAYHDAVAASMTAYYDRKFAEYGLDRRK